MDYSKLDELVEKCDYETKLAVTRWVMKNIVDHANEGGSYRYLIYERLGFDFDAYTVLCDEGMFISNNLDIQQMDLIKEIVRENKIEQLKKVLCMCDEPGCYKDVTCGWPDENGGYRNTCSEHYKCNNEKK